LDQAKVAATFTLTEDFSMACYNQCFAGIYLSDGGSPPNIIVYGIQALSATSPNNQNIMAFTYSGFTLGSIAAVFLASSGSSPPFIGPLYSLRVQETVSARIYFACSDGINCVQIFSESNTAHFTTQRYGFAIWNDNSGATNPDAMMTDYHFAATNP
jgi:hypothetical protein